MSQGGERTAHRACLADGLPDADLSPASSDPRRDGAIVPFTGEDSSVVVGDAVTLLVLLRAPMRLGDEGPAISALSSIIIQAEDLLFDAVAVLATRGDAIQVSYPGASKPVVGWVKATELTSASPPKR